MKLPLAQDRVVLYTVFHIPNTMSHILYTSNAILPSSYCVAPLKAQTPQDRFGNYTVQRIIEYSRGEDWEELRRRLEAVWPYVELQGLL